MVMLTKQIKPTKRLIKLKMKMSDRMGGGGSEAYCFMGINTLMDKLEHLNSDLDSIMLEVRSINPIVGNVLANAAKAMGLDNAAKVVGMPKRMRTTKLMEKLLKIY